MKKASPELEALALKTQGLRRHFPDESAVAQLLDKMSVDIGKRKLRQKVLKEARKVQKIIGPRATAYRVVEEIIIALDSAAA